MHVYTLGDGDPDTAIVAGVHGDEVCGVAAVDRFRSSDITVRKPVKLIVANEEALELGERYVDTDLNRAFPGNPDSSLHEERLAHRLVEELSGLSAVLDLHSTQSYDQPFAVVSTLNTATASLIPATGVEHVADFSALGGNSLIDHCDGVVVECGLTGSDQAAENAYQVMMNFLAAHGVIDRRFTMTDPALYRITDRVPKEANYTLAVENFERVENGQMYAHGETGELVADEPFYPVLMSENGYSDILGFRAEKMGTLSEVATR